MLNVPCEGLVLFPGGLFVTGDGFDLVFGELFFTGCVLVLGGLFFTAGCVLVLAAGCVLVLAAGCVFVLGGLFVVSVLVFLAGWILQGVWFGGGGAEDVEGESSGQAAGGGGLHW